MGDCGMIFGELGGCEYSIYRYIWVVERRKPRNDDDDIF